MEDFVTRVEYDVQIKRIDDENNRQNHRIGNLENTLEVVNRLATNIEKLTVQIANMQTEIERQGNKLQKIEDEPANDWKQLRRTIITGIVSALVAYFLAKGGII